MRPGALTGGEPDMTSKGARRNRKRNPEADDVVELDRIAERWWRHGDRCGCWQCSAERIDKAARAARTTKEN